MIIRSFNHCLCLVLREFFQFLKHIAFTSTISSRLSPHNSLFTNSSACKMLALLPFKPYSATLADVIRLLPSPSIIVTTSAGTEHIDLSECSRHGVQVVPAGGGQQFAEDVADTAVGLLIDVMCIISAADHHVRKWGHSKPCNFYVGSKLEGKRVGIVGLGRIGGEVAKRLEAFGCRIMYHSRNKKPFVSYPFYSNVVELAGNSDVLLLCCPINEKTLHKINREVMLALGKDRVIVNVRRGHVIDEKELVRGMMEGEIGGAGLDVFENEPNVPKQLFALDNVVLTPHAAADTKESWNKLCELVAESLEAFFLSRLQRDEIVSLSEGLSLMGWEELFQIVVFC